MFMRCVFPSSKNTCWTNTSFANSITGVKAEMNFVIVVLIVVSFFIRRSSMKVRFLLSPLSHKIPTREGNLTGGIGTLNARQSHIYYYRRAVLKS